MGNVLAATSRASPASPASPASSSATKVPLEKAAKQGLPELSCETSVAAPEELLDNPGTVEELHKKCKDVQATTFEGAKVILNKNLSNYFQVSHTLNLCSRQPSGYHFGATYVGSKQYGPTEAYPILLGDIDPSGNLNANIIHQFSNRVRCKFVSQIQESKCTAAQLTTDYRGNDFTASLTVGNLNIFNNSGVFVGHYLQSVTKSVALGTELVYQYGLNVPGGEIAVVSAVGRYRTNNATWSGTLCPGGIQICYYQKASEQLQIGIEVDTNLRMLESVATVGYQVDLPKADFTFKGSFDSNWNVCGVLEKRLQPLPFSFVLSGRLNHNKNQFRFGCGIIMD